jgi:hypothetical protein
MKRIQNIFLISSLLLILIAIIPPTMAQEPPHPPTIGHGAKGNQAPTGAPVGSGTLILVSMGMMYAGKKIFHFKKEED